MRRHGRDDPIVARKTRLCRSLDAKARSIESWAAASSSLNTFNGQSEHYDVVVARTGQDGFFPANEDGGLLNGILPLGDLQFS
jgi:hypothetical protein